jgi:hypothetical protein
MSGVIAYTIYDGMPFDGVWQTTPNAQGPSVTALDGSLQYRVTNQPASNQWLALSINDPQPTDSGVILTFDLRANTVQGDEVKLTLAAGVILRFTNNGTAAAYQWWNGSFQTLAASSIRPDGTWHRIVMAFAANELTLFEDGAPLFTWQTAVGATVSPNFTMQVLTAGANLSIDIASIFVLPRGISLSASSPWDYGFSENQTPSTKLMSFRIAPGGPQVTFENNFVRFAGQPQTATNAWTFLDMPRSVSPVAVFSYALRVYASGGSETKVTLPGDNILRITNNGASANWCSWDGTFHTLAASSIVTGASSFVYVTLVISAGGMTLLENGVRKYVRAYSGATTWNPGIAVQHLDPDTDVVVDVGGIRTMPTTKPSYVISVDTSHVAGCHAYTVGQAPALGSAFPLGQYGIQVTGLGYARVEPQVGGVTINGGPVWNGSGALVITVNGDGSFTTSAPAQSGRLITEYPVTEPPSPNVTSLTFSVQTGSSGGSWYDGPGTDADLSVKIGDPNGRNTGWVTCDNWGNDLEAGQWDVYDIPPASGLTMADLKTLTLRLQIPTSLSGNDAWNIAQMKLVANGAVVYNNTHVNSWLNSSAASTNQWTWPLSLEGSDVDRPYDHNCFVCAHNAFAAEDSGWWIAQQKGTIASQLAGGVRALMLDVWPYPYPAVSSSQATLCHELDKWQNTGVDYLMKPLSSYEPLKTELQAVKTFADANPSAVITLIFESYVTQALMQAAFAAVPGLSGQLVLAGQPLSGWDWANGWPTLRWMTDHNKRIVVFTSNRSDGFPYLWDYAVENVYGSSSLDPNTWVRKRGESSSLGTSSKTLCVLNHFPDISFRAIMWSSILTMGTLPIQNYYQSQTNDGDTIKQQVQACQSQYSGRLPNFIAVDFYELGNNGGAFAAARAVNASWATR